MIALAALARAAGPGGPAAAVPHLHGVYAALPGGGQVSNSTALWSEARWVEELRCADTPVRTH